MEAKSIPCLELAGILLGVENLIDLKNELSGAKSTCPINIVELCLFTDSLSCLSWLTSFAKLDKMNKKSIFAQNRIEKINKLCAQMPINFSFVDGISNPADYVTRAVSYRLLCKSNYLVGPEFLTNKSAALCRSDAPTVKLPSVLENIGLATVNAVAISSDDFSDRKFIKI